MHYVRLQRHKSNLASEKGSQVVGFALVAPLLITLALVVMQIVGIVICKVSLTTATKQAAHLASLKGSSSNQVLLAAQNYWAPDGFSSCGHSTSTKRTQSSGISFVVVRVEQCLEVPFLNRQVNLISTARELDEGKL
ncbi:MAG: pilus assembly protein [Actinobacteria bacterium]|nr:pilus assembly protein [Actinomycetota bacterium]